MQTAGSQSARPRIGQAPARRRGCRRPASSPLIASGYGATSDGNPRSRGRGRAGGDVLRRRGEGRRCPCGHGGRAGVAQPREGESCRASTGRRGPVPRGWRVAGHAGSARCRRGGQAGDRRRVRHGTAAANRGHQRRYRRELPARGTGGPRDHQPRRRRPAAARRPLVADNSGTLPTFVVAGLFIHDVNGTQREKDNGGIIFRTRGDRARSRYDGLRIERNIIWRVDRSGIAADSTHCLASRWFPSTNVVIRDNWVGDVGGDGIVPWATDGCLVEHNIVQGANERARQLQRRHLAVVHRQHRDPPQPRVGREDAQGRSGLRLGLQLANTLLEFNLSHDNEGGFLLICSPGNRDSRDNMGNLGHRGALQHQPPRPGPDLRRQRRGEHAGPRQRRLHRRRAGRAAAPALRLAGLGRRAPPPQ